MTTLRLRDQQLHWRDIDGEIVALDGRESLYLAANSSGALLWRALAKGATRQELTAQLVEAYELGAATAAEHTDHFLAQLATAGLVDSPAAEPARG